jgi:hypothetical protein
VPLELATAVGSRGGSRSKPNWSKERLKVEAEWGRERRSCGGSEEDMMVVETNVRPRFSPFPGLTALSSTQQCSSAAPSFEPLAVLFILFVPSAQHPKLTEFVIQLPFSSSLDFLQETITRLLYSIGTKREVERYLRIFSSSSNPSQPAKFAVIKIGGAVLEQLNELALSLSFLYRVGLYPVILHGGGPQLNEIIERGGVVPEYIDGIRVTGTHISLLSILFHSTLKKMRKPYKLLAVYFWMRT